MEKFFFIIPVYNVEKYLARCIDSVLAQTYKNIEIVLVDDGSPDGCPAICDEYASKFNNIKVIHKQNGGLSDARNAGLDYLDTVADDNDFVNLLDSDDFVSPDMAEITSELCRVNNCDICNVEYEKGSEDSFSEDSEECSVFCESAEDALLDRRLKSLTCTKIWRFFTFKGVRFPVGVWNEDEFTTYKAIYNAKRICFTNQKLYYYYQRSGSIMDSIAKKLKNNPHAFDWYKAYEERIAFFEKENKPVQVMRTHEKICTDIILRYCEQMYLKKCDRDEASINGRYLRMYKESFKKMINLKSISLKRKLMYISFRICPKSAVITSKVFGLRK